MTSLPMFPLGSLLFPAMPIQLRLFEERYIVMLSRILQHDDPEFGVVLIERGQEVGGGEQRFSIGTVARIVKLDPGEGYVDLVGYGDRRIVVDEWMPDDPYPQARVTDLPDFDWDDSLAELREETEGVVRRTIAAASEFVELPWSASIELADDPVAAAWQLAAIAPVGPLDQVALLRSASLAELFTSTMELTLEAAQTLTTGWTDVDDELPGV